MKNYIIGGAIILLIIAGLAYPRVSGQGVTEDAHGAIEHAHGFAADLNDPNKLYIATHEGLFVLLNEREQSRVGESQDDLMGFAAHPKVANIFFSSGHSRSGNIGVQKTTDGGLTWEKLSSGLNGPVDFHAFAVSQANPDILYGSFRGLQRSQDGGKTWEMVAESVQPHSLSTHPREEDVVYATGNGVYKSADKGATWTSLSPQLEGGSVSVFAFSPDASFALAFAENLGGLGKSTDDGVTWTKVESAFDAAVMYIAFNTNAAYAMTAKNSIYKSTDRGATWQKVL